jgi:D-alanine-D-alanine ligase-like ATP-grasp enzyme
MGITASSFCADETALRSAIDRLSQYGPVLVEEFLSGDEYTVGIIDGEPIGVMQVLPQRPSDPATQRPPNYAFHASSPFFS